MRSFSAVAPLLVGAASALPEFVLTKRDAHLRASNLARGVVKRSGGTLGSDVYDVLTWSAGGAYYTNVSVGTPPQDQVVIVDTGSSDLYFDASTSQACESTGANSCRGGTFNPKKSSTYKVALPAPAFNTSFGDGSYAIGPYSQDVVSIGDVSIANVQFGVGQDVNSTTGYAIGLMGIGYSFNEAELNAKYPNMPEVLVDAGVINSRLYSVFLNSVGETSGTILFGGIDTSKYTGELVTVDMLPDPNPEIQFVFEFLTSVTGLSASVNGKTSTIFSGGASGFQTFESDSGSLPVLLDTGSAAWSVPSAVLESILQYFPYVSNDGTCSCEHRSSGATITLEFAGKVSIEVPSSEFIVPFYDPVTNEPAKGADGSDLCLFMIAEGNQEESGGFLTLGDAILRSMYVVFDLDNGQLSIAQAAVNSTASPNVVTIAAGPSGIASAISTSYSAAPSNTWSIAAAQPATLSFSASTDATPLGTATGTNAIPIDARPGAPQETSPEGGSNAGGTPSGSSSTSSGAAAGIVIPGVDWTPMYVSSVAVFMAALGAAIML